MSLRRLIFQPMLFFSSRSLAQHVLARGVPKNRRVIPFNLCAAGDSLLTEFKRCYSLTSMPLRLLKHLSEESLSA